jgi:hypothetical protein
VLVFHDSCGDGLVNFLPVYFSRVVFSHTGRGFDRVLVEDQKPDIVIWEMVERHLLRVP